MTTLKEWLDQQRALPKSPIGEAIGYALNHWVALERYLEAGFLEIDNGTSEHAVKLVAIGRKNWLFAGSKAGGKTAAILMSLCTTCKNLKIDPLAYLTDVLRRAAAANKCPRFSVFVRPTASLTARAALVNGRDRCGAAR